MQITLEINNPYYAEVLQEMAEAIQLEPRAVCAGIIERQIADYADAMREYKHDLVFSMLGENAQGALNRANTPFE